MRFRWSMVPMFVQALGAVGEVVAFAIIGRVFRENTFLAPVVRVQEERGQTVVSTGPYAVVRHPMYAGALILFLATPLLLGSWWGLAAAVALTAAMSLRIPLEERELRRSLPGYAEYALRVRYRLLPGVW
ncbi:MAG: isoprenylcysteine carboxylmethyltransferase family protein [Chloroflexi bacterium]|nr:MAG: isoprenylcysteine carboxylmethyltransferase family protein [Chloroflexota bacterium]